MDATGKLAEYPELARWFREHGQGGSEAREPGEALVVRTCEALRFNDHAAVRHWLEAFKIFLARSSAPLSDFLAAQELMHLCDAEFLDLIGEFGEAAVGTELGGPFLDAMRAGANSTGLTVLRFLSAWTALNTGRLQDCVDECEKVDMPHGPVFTVQGQALLELGAAREAAEVLEVAVKLAPGEILAWFQLAKAHHVLNRHEPALKALRECRRLAPQSDEVALYFGMIALEGAPVVAKAAPAPSTTEAVAIMRPLARRHAGNAVVIFTLLRLMIRAGDAVGCGEVLDGCDMPTLRLSTAAMTQLAPVLRDLHAVGWMHVAGKLLGAVTAQTGEAS